MGLVALNLKRFWAADEIFFYQAGETISFQGVKAIWVASMNAEKLKAGLTGNFFTDTLIKRDTNWLYKKGKPVYLLRAPGNKVWVLQVYGHQVDPTLSMETMDQLGASSNCRRAGNSRQKSSTRTWPSSHARPVASPTFFVTT